MLKAAIAIVFIALLISLASGYLFLMRDKGKTRRTLYSLGIRLVLAGILMALLFYGFTTGQLRSQAPWEQPAVSHPSSEHINKQE